MPLFFFDVEFNGKLDRDPFGIELKSLEEARSQAIGLLPEIALDEKAEGEHRTITAMVRCHLGHIRYRTTLTIDGGWVEPPTTDEIETAADAP